MLFILKEDVVDVIIISFVKIRKIKSLAQIHP